MASVKRVSYRQKYNDADSDTEAPVNLNTLLNKVNKSSKYEDVKGKIDFGTVTQPCLINMEAGSSSSSHAEVNAAAAVNLTDFFSVDISNRYGVLTDTTPASGMDTLPAPDHDDGNPVSTPVNKNASVKAVKPPPICFVSKLTKNLTVFRDYCDKISRNYYFHFASDRTLLYYHSIEDYKAFITKYKDILPFYTYTPRGEKTHAYLIKGLHASVECEDVLLELRELNIDVKSVVQFKNTRNPIYMCVMAKNISLKDLQVKGRYLQRTKVYYEHYINKKELTQCKKCQIWGHATANCFLKYTRCVKCAGEHRSFECEKSRDIPAICANCGKDHPASSLQCETYLKHLEEKKNKLAKTKVLMESRTPKKPAYIDAPLPAENAWVRRREESASQPMPTDAGVRCLPNLGKPSPSPRREVPSSQSRGSREHESTQDEAETINGGLQAIESIADIMRDIRKMCDLQWLANILHELRSEMQKCRTVVEYAMVVDNFNQKYAHKIRCP